MTNPKREPISIDLRRELTGGTDVRGSVDEILQRDAYGEIAEGRFPAS